MPENFQFEFFVAAQVVFGVFLTRSWVQIYIARPSNAEGVRRWFALGSLICASIALLLTTGMTIYSKIGQRHPYDKWEGLYLFYTAILSVLGIILGISGKWKPRLVGLITSVFTLLIALADAIAM